MVVVVVLMIVIVEVVSIRIVVAVKTGIKDAVQIIEKLVGGQRSLKILHEN